MPSSFVDYVWNVSVPHSLTLSKGASQVQDNVRRSLITTWPLICFCILCGRVCLNHEKEILKKIMIKSLGPCKESNKMLCFLSVDGQPEFLGILIFP